MPASMSPMDWTTYANHTQREQGECRRDSFVITVMYATGFDYLAREQSRRLLCVLVSGRSQLSTFTWYSNKAYQREGVKAYTLIALISIACEILSQRGEL